MKTAKILTTIVELNWSSRCRESEVLRGIKGVKYIQKTNTTEMILQGWSDTIAVQGEDINLTLDAELQRYGEQLMINKRGGIVAIEPKKGEILALVTAPSYDPSILVEDALKLYLIIPRFDSKTAIRPRTSCWIPSRISF
jgi:cell division protein FtsI/penicillin-binding protein 2